MNLIIDESGTMGNINKDKRTWTNYFIIAGYLVDDIGLSTLNSIYLKKELEIKNRKPNHYSSFKEIKGINILPNDCSEILKFISDETKTFIPFSIVVCKNHINKKVWNENVAFNYFLKLLLIYLINNNIIQNNQEINIYLDNRGKKNPLKYQLKEYLEQETYLDTLGNQQINFNIKDFQYKDSKATAYIRCADLIAYSILKFHENKSKRDRKFIKALYEQKINLHKYKKIFPTFCIKNDCIIYLSNKIQNKSYPNQTKI